MARKTQTERGLIDYPIAIRRTKPRARKIEYLRVFEATYGCLSTELLEAFGSSEWHQGFTEGVADVNGYEENELMNTITDYLAEQERLAEAATPGPWTWTAHTTVDVEVWTVFDTRRWAVADSGDGFKADAEFIAAACTSVPRMVAALQAVLKEHEPGPYAPSWCSCEQMVPCTTREAVEAALEGEGE